MTKKEATLILRMIAMTKYKYEDEDEVWLMQNIKLKLMNIHPDQDAARERGYQMTLIINRLLISLIALMLLCSSIILYLHM